MATLSDVAAKAGVSISAVSRVLSNAPSARVSQQTRDRIQNAARELDYRPNFAARALKFSRTNVIALIVPDLTNAIFTELMKGVEDAAAERGYMVLLARAEGLETRGETIARLVGEGRVDGVLVQIGDATTADELEALVDGRIPAVLINSSHRGKIGSVALADAAAARVAVDHLVALGHTRIGLINGFATTDTAVRRGQGFVDAMADARLPVDQHLVTQLGYEAYQGRAALRSIMTSDRPPTAIVVANVNAAIGALAEARELGLSVPADLSIVAIHDAWTAENTWPPLSTVKMPLYELGQRAVASIYDRLETGATDDIVISEPAPLLVTRESTALLA